MAKDDDSSILEDNGITLLTGEIEDENCEDVVRWILEENIESRHEMLTLIINSNGGNLSSGFAVIDAMCGSKIPIRTIGMGELSSMGLTIFITGKERILTPNTLILSHQWEGGTGQCKEHELLAGIKRNQLVSDMIIRHYRKYTGLTEKDIRKYLLCPSDVYLTAKEAKELNLCDEVRLDY